MVIIDNKSERNENKRENFIYTDRALLQQITLFEEKKKKKTKLPWVAYSFDLASALTLES